MLISPAKISNRRIADWSARILFVLVAVSAAQLTWLLVPAGDGQLGEPVVSRSPAAGGGAEARPGLASVARLDLFGRAEQPVAEEQKAVDAPQTRLNLTLRGVVAAGEGPSARAIIAAPGQPEEHYRIGENLPGGAVLDQVLADRVILRRGGRLEALHLPKEASVGSVASGARDAGPLPSAAGGPELPASAIRKLQEYREKIIREPQQALSLARVQPVMEDGKLKGYRLSPTRERQLFRQMGLQPGDVVTSVNGIGLDNPAEMGQVFSQLSQAGELNLTVERNGVPTSITVPFGQ